MTQEELALKLQEVDDRAKSNTHRLNALEKLQESIYELASSVRVMATDLTNMRGDVNRVTEKVEDLAAVPGKRWETVVGDIVKLLVAAAVGYLLGM